MTAISLSIALILLAIVLLASLALLPLGLPGLWVMLGVGVLYAMLVPAGGIGLWTLLSVSALVLVAELLEFTISARYTRQFGGSRRASWGAILGAMAGAILGVPVPVVGSVLGAFLGAFVGALVAEWSVHRAERGQPVRVATGAVLGRVVATGAKVGLGVLVSALLFTAALFGGTGSPG